MTKDEIKLALDAVLIGFKAERFMTDADYTLQDKAVIVLQEALNASLAEQPAPVAKPHEQEPVAWINPNEQNARKAFHWVKSEEFTSPVYTTPPAQRTWVGPDFLTAHDPETPEYRNGWNDCRQVVMEMYRREST